MFQKIFRTAVKHFGTRFSFGPALCDTLGRLRLLLALTCVLGWGCGSERPNIILFMVDDLGWMDTTVYGSRYYVTPNIERLASEGMTFTQAYAASPLCSPTRASLMTGKSPARLRFTRAIGHLGGRGDAPFFVRDVKGVPSRGYLPLMSELTIAEVLVSSGYRTGFIGKWHLGRHERFWPEHQGFEVNVGGGSYSGPPGGYFDPYQNARLENRRAGEYLTDRLTDEALAFIEAHQQGPFFLCLWHYGVHAPWGHKEETTAKYREKQDPRGKQNNPVMASMVESIDESLGRLMDGLMELGLWENTLFVFYSDNGGNVHSRVEGLAPTNNAPLRAGKGSVYEGGTRVPLIVAWPHRIEAGTRSDALVSSPDFYPTFLAAAGAGEIRQQHIDGRSFLPVLQGHRTEHREEVFVHMPHLRTPGSSIRKGDWKLIRFYERSTNGTQEDRFELYNLRDDVGETNDLSNVRPELTAELVARLDAYLAETNALLPGRSPLSDPAASKSGAPPSSRALEPMDQGPESRQDVLPKK